MKYHPPAGSQDPDAKYVTGQPGKVRGSAVPAEAVEHPQREIVEVIRQAGLTPSGDDLTQLWQAIGQAITAAKPGLATTTAPGLVQIGDGLSITTQGLLSVLTATAAQAGIMRPDGTTCRVQDGVLSVPQQVNEYMEGWRTSWVGVPRPWRGTALPPDHCWANGDFVAFADWPELKDVYEAGGFAGLLLDWDADSETQAAQLGRWRPDAAEPTGLYTPNLTGQFLRCWGPGIERQAGSWQADAFQGHGHILYAGVDSGSSGGGGYMNFWQRNHDKAIKEPISLDGYGTARIADETRPANLALPVIIYLGQPAAN